MYAAVAGRVRGRTQCHASNDGSNSHLESAPCSSEDGILRDESASWRERRQQQFQHRHLAAIAAGRPLGDVLEALLVDFETEHAGALGSVLLLDQGSGQLRHAAGARLPEPYRQAVDGVCIGGG